MGGGGGSSKGGLGGALGGLVGGVTGGLLGGLSGSSSGGSSTNYVTPQQVSTPQYAEQVAVTDAAQDERERQLKAARAAYGSSSTVKTSPFGSQESTNNQVREFAQILGEG